MSLTLKCSVTDWRERRYKHLNYVHALTLGVTFPLQLLRLQAQCLL
jgi:hypothetical protein